MQKIKQFFEKFKQSNFAKWIDFQITLSKPAIMKKINLYIISIIHIPFILLKIVVFLIKEGICSIKKRKVYADLFKSPAKDFFTLLEGEDNLTAKELLDKRLKMIKGELGKVDVLLNYQGFVFNFYKKFVDTRILVINFDTKTSTYKVGGYNEPVEVFFGEPYKQVLEIEVNFLNDRGKFYDATEADQIRTNTSMVLKFNDEICIGNKKAMAYLGKTQEEMLLYLQKHIQHFKYVSRGPELQERLNLLCHYYDLFSQQEAI